MKVRGYAAVFGNLDAHDEIIDEGAFSDWIAENPSKSVPVFWQHDHVGGLFSGSHERPIGVTTLLRQNAKGLYFEAELADTEKAREIGTLLQAGAIKGASFAFGVRDQYEQDEVWHLKSLNLKEISAVNWGANPEAYIEIIPQEQSDEG